ncbi:MAG: hypothetical protein JO258_02405, partial [Alphaproteobacteria bacterium]|nr:hypothetical protein [Alphaproteobacteria bacterium]
MTIRSYLIGAALGLTALPALAQTTPAQPPPPAAPGAAIGHSQTATVRGG